MMIFSNHVCGVGQPISVPYLKPFGFTANKSSNSRFVLGYNWSFVAAPNRLSFRHQPKNTSFMVYCCGNGDNIGSSSEWDWNRLSRHFSEIEQTESYASVLKPQACKHRPRMLTIKTALISPSHPSPSFAPSITAASEMANLLNISQPINRRHLLLTFFSTISLSSLSVSLPVATARGLLQMPPPRLSNRYFLVRSGESEYESLGIINTNPVAKTSVDSGLSEKGKKQIVRAALELKEKGACENNCWIWPSITQRAYQAAEIIAAVNGVSRSYIVPEYSFLDARGLGAYEGKKLEAVSEVYESDRISSSIKPPPIDDGTPNESVADVFVRVTQLMSILETQYSEDTVIIVSPDSDNLTILQAGLVGLDLRRHRDLSFAPGEVRYVDPASIPTYKQPASAVYKCLNPPKCN